MGNAQPNSKLILSQILDKINKVEVPEGGVELTEIPALKLQEMIFSGEVTYPEVVQAFHRQKIAEQNRHFALTEVLFEGPLAEAQAWQARLQGPGGLSPADAPLLGFVLVVKDHMLLEGTLSTCGLATNLGHPWNEKVEFFDFLRRKGAVIMSKGNVPQGMLAIESTNNMFGTTKHPLRPSRTPGGSSGGDAAAVCLGLANISFSSDGAGSLRIPASFCGLATIKTTSLRFDTSVMGGMLRPRPDFGTTPDAIRIFQAVLGPLARDCRDLAAFFRVYAEFREINRHLPPLVWRTPSLRPRIGVLKEFDLLEPTVTARRALNTTCDILRAKGFEIVELDINHLMTDLFRTIMGTLFKSNLLIDIISGKHHMNETPIEAYRLFIQMIKAPTVLLRTLKSRFPIRQQIVIDAQLDSRELNNIHFIEKMGHYRGVFTKLFRELGIDLCLTHSIPPAMLHGTTSRCSLVALYFFIWNFLDFVAGVVPVTTVREDEEVYESKYDDVLSQAVVENMKGSAGLPVSVQVVGLPYLEEEVLEVMQIVEDSCGFLPSYKFKA